MEVVIGEGRSLFNMEKGMVWRDYEDEGFGLEVFEVIIGYVYLYYFFDMLDN